MIQLALDRWFYACVFPENNGCTWLHKYASSQHIAHHPSCMTSTYAIHVLTKQHTSLPGFSSALQSLQNKYMSRYCAILTPRWMCQICCGIPRHELHDKTEVTYSTEASYMCDATTAKQGLQYSPAPPGMALRCSCPAAPVPVT